MVERTDDTLTDILKAASDPTRRAILTQLAHQGPTRVTDLAACFHISLNAVSKHIKVLESAGLVSRQTLWREHLIALQVAPLGQIDQWFRNLRSIWDLRLDALETLLTETKPEAPNDQHTTRPDDPGSDPDPEPPHRGQPGQGL